MLSISGQVKVFIAAQPTDMRKSFDTLAALVQEVLKLDPLSGHLFMFRGKRGDGVKILWWDRDGLAIYYKRLEKGTFQFPCGDGASGKSLAISSTELMQLLAGCAIAVP